jgi:hypothetical protein
MAACGYLQPEMCQLFENDAQVTNSSLDAVAGSSRTKGQVEEAARMAEGDSPVLNAQNEPKRPEKRTDSKRSPGKREGPSKRTRTKSKMAQAGLNALDLNGLAFDQGSRVSPETVPLVKEKVCVTTSW